MERFLILALLMMPSLMYGAIDFNDLSNRVAAYKTEYQKYLSQGGDINSTKQPTVGDVFKAAVARVKRALDNQRIWLEQEIKNSSLNETQKQELLNRLS